MSEKSICCNAKIKVVGKTTLHYECCKCHKACDIYIKERIKINMDLSTKVIPDKRQKINKQVIDKEIQEIGNA